MGKRVTRRGRGNYETRKKCGKEEKNNQNTKHEK
jgi:hypothetical protein